MQGRYPLYLRQADDSLPVVQINTASVVDDTGGIRTHLAAAFADGHLDERDVPNLLEVARLANRAQQTCIETDDFCGRAREALNGAIQAREPLRRTAPTHQVSA